jgi:hypothetical protein
VGFVLGAFICRTVRPPMGHGLCWIMTSLSSRVIHACRRGDRTLDTEVTPLHATHTHSHACLHPRPSRTPHFTTSTHSPHHAHGQLIYHSMSFILAHAPSIHTSQAHSSPPTNSLARPATNSQHSTGPFCICLPTTYAYPRSLVHITRTI